VAAERRNSEDAGGREKSRDPARRFVQPYQQYQYVRQWSVDVAALADQLENPKAHLGNSSVTLASRQQVGHAASNDPNTGMPQQVYRQRAERPKGLAACLIYARKWDRQTAHRHETVALRFPVLNRPASLCFLLGHSSVLRCDNF